MLEVFEFILEEYNKFGWQCLDRPCATAYQKFDHRVVACVENMLRTYGRIEDADKLREVFEYLDQNLEPKPLEF